MVDIQLISDVVIRFCASRSGQTLGRVVVGVIGVLILAAFLAALFTVGAVTTLFPVVVGFNTALTGYGIVDKTREGYRRKRLVAVGAGMVVVLAGTVATNLLFWQLAGAAPIRADLLWVLLPVGIVTSWLGAALAIKYFGLK